MDFRRAKSIFLIASREQIDKRRALLDTLCGGDVPLRSQVERWLSVSEGIGDFGETPILDPGPLQYSLPREPDYSGRYFGQYRAVRILARGGMSIVYLGFRSDDPHRKPVAIKITDLTRAGDDLESSIQREHQILAGLDHASIVRLYDAGMTGDGRAYLVMEYVSGRPIDAYCRELALFPKRRMQLFLRVCEAVAYTHRKSVVHQDLKPSNILVASRGMPKIIDFGIAKQLGQDEPAATRMRTRRMTPGYASPEQIRGAAVTSASDVYSLGLVLQQLLTQRQDFEARPILHSVKRWQLQPGIESILSKALREEPKHRYTSVEAFAADIHRYMQGVPLTVASNVN